MSALTDAREAVGGLSKPSKLPCSAYSIPAKECKAGSVLRTVDGSVCRICYALKGRGLFPNVQAAQYRRMATIDNPAWCANMATAINGAPFFRWFDAGDLQSVDMLRKIIEVCNATPKTRHWLPTRERSIIREYLRGGVIPDNLTIRLSATMIDGDVKSPWENVNTSSVHKDKPAKGFTCPSAKQSGKCADCRACWDQSIQNVSYGAH